MRLLHRLFGPFFVLAGAMHFVTPRTYEAIMPDYLPRHRELVYASGVAEIVAGAAAMHPKTRRFGAQLGIATLVGVFPANLHMVLNADRYPQIPGGRKTLIARLPLQLLLIAWARAAGR
jgi:uncharacterized membrane protein